MTETLDTCRCLFNDAGRCAEERGLSTAGCPCPCHGPNLQHARKVKGEPPLFVPLARKYFEQFQSREKSSEWRQYGPRWNETTCRPGRAVTLSCGYSGVKLHGHIVGTQVHPLADCPHEARSIFPNAKQLIEIRIHLAETNG